MNYLSKFLAVVTLIVVVTALIRSVVITNAADPRAGINIDPLNPAGQPTASQLTAAGVKWVRFVQKSDSFNYRALLESYSKAGIKTVLVLNQETLWPSSGNGNFNDSYIQSFAAKARALAQKYGSLVSTYEIWNEPDVSSRASIFVPAERYKILFKQTYGAIKSANPSSQVIIGGLVSGNTDYLDALKEPGGTLLADGVGIHPYSTDPATITSTLERYQSHTSGKPLWLTEFGWETGENSGQTQANFLGAVYSAIYTNSKLATIPTIMWYSWSDGMGSGFGLLSKSGVAKPALTAYLIYASKVAAASDIAQLAKLIAQIQLTSLPGGQIPILTGSGTALGGSKLGIFVHGSPGGSGDKVISAKPKVLKLMIAANGSNLSEVEALAVKFKAANPGGITILRYYDWPPGAPILSPDPVTAANESFREYSRFLNQMGRNLSAFDYFETPNESERINHWGSHLKANSEESKNEVRWQNTFWSTLIDLNYNQFKLKTCAASLTPGYLHPEHVPLLKDMFSKLKQTGGTLCYHGYEDGSLTSTDKGSNAFWYENFYDFPEIAGVKTLISELGISDGWKGENKGAPVYQKWLKLVDCRISNDPNVLGAAIYEIGSEATGVYSINDPVMSDWLANYLSNPAQNNSECTILNASPQPPPTIPPGPTCNPAGDGTITVLGPSCGPSDPTNPADPKAHPDINIKLRGFKAEDGSAQKLVDYRGSFTLDVDPKSPNVNELFSGGSYHPIINSYRVGDWDGTTWAQDDWLNATAFEVKPNENIYVPDSGYEIGCGYEVMVLYADENSIFIKYTLEDNAIAGYGIHILGISPTQKIRTLYEQMNKAGRKNLPALKAGELLGTAIDPAILVVYRDTGAFLDPRSCIDNWPGCPSDGYPNTPAPSSTRTFANNLFASPKSVYWQRDSKRIDHRAACDVLSLESYPTYPPLGSLEACPLEFPKVGEFKTNKAAAPTPSPTYSCSLTATKEHPECQDPSLLTGDTADEYCNVEARWCYPESLNTFISKGGYDCSRGNNPNPYANYGQLVKKVCLGEGADPNSPSDGVKAQYRMWQNSLACYRGQSKSDFASLAPNDKNDISRCLGYYEFLKLDKRNLEPATPAAIPEPEELITLPSCIPTRAQNSDRCTSSCGDPVILSEQLGFSLKGDCATGQCKATITLDPNTPLYVPFAKKLANYFMGTLDYGQVAEGGLSEDELLKIREEVRAGKPSAIKQLFNESGVARKLLPAQIQNELRCRFLNYVKRKDALWGTPEQENTKYIYLVDGQKEIMTMYGLPVTEIEPPPYVNPTTCKQQNATGETIAKWSQTPSAKAWVDVPLFDNEETQSKIEFAGTGIFTNSLNPIQTSVPEIRRLYNVTSVIQKALIPDFDLQAVAEPVNPTALGAPTPQSLKLTVGPPLTPGDSLVACKPSPTPTLDQVFGDYDNEPTNSRYALEDKKISSYKIGVDCVQQGVPFDPDTKSRVCTVGPEGQLNCFQQLPRTDNVITKEFSAVAQTRNVTPYLFDVFLQTIDKSGGFLRIFKPPSSDDQVGYEASPKDPFQRYYQPYPAESERVKFTVPTAQGVTLDETNNTNGWRMLFDKLGGVWTAQQFVLKSLQPPQD